MGYCSLWVVSHLKESMNIIVDLILMGLLNLFKDSPVKRQRKAFKNRKAIAEETKRREDTSLTYIILDDLGKNNGDFQYQEPPEDLHCCDSDGPNW